MSFALENLFVMNYDDLKGNFKKTVGLSWGFPQSGECLTLHPFSRYEVIRICTSWG
jgi:hypothetical protein